MSLFFITFLSGSQIGREARLNPGRGPARPSLGPVEQGLSNAPRRLLSPGNGGADVHYCPGSRNSIQTSVQPWPGRKTDLRGDEGQAGAEGKEDADVVAGAKWTPK